jgi:hypothetical protein
MTQQPPSQQPSPQESPPGNLRKAIALIAGIAICILLITPFALAINSFDWGVGLLLVAPLLVWFLLWVGKALERWAHNEPDGPPPDPDFPDELTDELTDDLPGDSR